MGNTKTLANFLSPSIEISNYAFRDEQGRIYRPLRKHFEKKTPQLFVIFLDTRVIKTSYLDLKDAMRHKYVKHYSRSIMVE